MQSSKIEFTAHVNAGGYRLAWGYKLQANELADEAFFPNTCEISLYITDGIPVIRCWKETLDAMLSTGDISEGIPSDQKSLEKIIDSLRKSEGQKSFWELAGGINRDERLTRPIHRQFSCLHTVKEMWGFAQQYGLLTAHDLAAHFEVYSKGQYCHTEHIEAVSADIKTEVEPFVCIEDDSPDGEPFEYYFGEPISLWITEIQVMKLACAFRDILQSDVSRRRLREAKDIVSREREALLAHAQHPHILNDLLASDQSILLHLQRWTNQHIADNVTPELLSGESGSHIILKPCNLLGFMWLHFAHELAGLRFPTCATSTCKACGKPLVRLRSTKLYCNSACKMAYRRKHGLSVSPHV